MDFLSFGNLSRWQSLNRPQNGIKAKPAQQYLGQVAHFIHSLESYPMIEILLCTLNR